jgi:hypothetical protein
MVVALVAFAIAALIGALVLAVAVEPGPSPGDATLGYELAWDRLDFDALWTLSGRELRDGRTKPEFIAAKREAFQLQPELVRLARHVALEDVVAASRVAAARTRVELRDGAVVHNDLRLAKRQGRWEVVAYQLQPEASAPRPMP